MFKIYLKYRKSTPGTHVFDEVGIDGSPVENFEKKIPSVYIRKGAIKSTLGILVLTLDSLDELEIKDEEIQDV